MNIKNLIKNNIKFITLMLIVIALGLVGIAFAIKVGNFNPIGINTTAADIDATIVFEGATEGKITNTGNLLPIDDNLVNLDITDSRVLKVDFNVTGVSSNPENTIYDISLREIDMACELKTGYLKWRLYKEDNILTEGTFSPTFDAMINNRMVLTEEQEDLSTDTNNYTLLIWISESCTEDITACDVSLSQNDYLNKVFNATVKIELSTESKKPLERTTSSENLCDYIETKIPRCLSGTYTGESKALIHSGNKIPFNPGLDVNYFLINNTGIDAGMIYAVTARLNNGYKWEDGTTEDKVLYCEIAKKNVTITSKNQTIIYGDEISSTPSDVTVSELIAGHSLESINLYSNIINVGTGIISSNNAKIIDANGNDVTNNYNITYEDIGVITINNAS